MAAVLTLAPRPARPAKESEPSLPADAAGPLEGYVICVDAGHGGADGGARARDSGAWEKTMNLSVAKKVCGALEKLGAQTVMTRENDDALNAQKRADITARMEVAKEAGADMLLSVHMNEYRTRRESGPQVFYRSGQEDSRLLAGALQSALIQGLNPKKERVAMAGDYYVLSLPIPSVLIECGFISNSEEEALLLKSDYQEKLAQAVADGVTEYLALKKQAARRILYPKEPLIDSELTPERAFFDACRAVKKSTRFRLDLI